LSPEHRPKFNLNLESLDKSQSLLMLSSQRELLTDSNRINPLDMENTEPKLKK
jgi:hypothetical protein